MKVLFAASPAIAIPALESILSIKEVKLAGLLTNCDAPKGRHGTLTPTEIGQAALNLQSRQAFPILKPLKLDAKAREEVSLLKADLLVSFAYGHIFGPKFLSLFPLGGINIHPSLLPKYRGPSPIQAAILNRDSETGISIQTLALQMDKGDILAQEKFVLNSRETTASLSETMAQKAALMLPSVLAKIASGLTRSPQNEKDAVYCKLISKDDGIINWEDSAAVIDAKIRAYNPWPLCRTIHNGRVLYILKADVFRGTSSENPGKVFNIDKQHGILIQTGDGILSVSELQYQAKKALFWRDFLNGVKGFIGSQLG